MFYFFYGGCNEGSTDVYYDKTQEQWEQIDFTDSVTMNYLGESADTVSGGKIRKKFNIKVGGSDRIGFRYPEALHYAMGGF